MQLNDVLFNQCQDDWKSHNHRKTLLSIVMTIDKSDDIPVQTIHDTTAYLGLL